MAASIRGQIHNRREKETMDELVARLDAELESASRPENELRAPIAAVAGKRDEVEQLADEWERNRPRGVDVVEMAKHPAYQRIIEIGVPAVPWLLARLEQSPNHWFLALHAITGATLVPAENQGKVKDMARAWINWGRENGYRW